MATRSRIGIELSDGSILSVYHHWDGYLEWLGRILNTYYNTKEKVSELIDGGDMSTCLDDDKQPKYYGVNDNPPRLDKDRIEYLLPDNSEEYAYIYSNQRWICYDMHQFDETKLPQLVEIPSSKLLC